jgi:streptogramin lyase
MVISVDPKTGKQQQFKLMDRKGDYFVNANNHTGMMDGHGRMWMSNIGQFLPIIRRDSQGENPAYCTDPNNEYAKYFPRPAKEARLASVFDPKTGKSEVIPMCFGTHHLNFDTNDRLYMSGDTEVVGWIDTKVWDKTKDPQKSVGWCPFVLDTNGDGKITPDRTQWNEQLEGIAGGEGADFRSEDDKSGKQTRYIDRPVTIESKPLDPTKDTRIAGFNYGMAVSPKDQSYWAAKYSPYIPSGIVRVEAGAHPPQTCKTEYYESPKINGKYAAFNARGVDVDADGVAWVAFGTGAIGKFDRSKCKVLNGPTATGQHCPEGWEIIPTPGPKFKGLNYGTDWFYLTFVDHHNSLGLGKEVPVFPNSEGDELLAYLPKEKKFVHMRVPYPLGFYARGVDGRIDDEKAGWKGRGLWATNNIIATWHQETGEGSSEFAAHFQVRPNPLAE